MHFEGWVNFLISTRLEHIKGSSDHHFQWSDSKSHGDSVSDYPDPGLGIGDGWGRLGVPEAQKGKMNQFPRQRPAFQHVLYCTPGQSSDRTMHHKVVLIPLLVLDWQVDSVPEYV